MASLTLALIGSLLVMDAAWSSGRGVEYGEAEMCSNDAMGQGRKSQVSTTYSHSCKLCKLTKSIKSCPGRQVIDRSVSDDLGITTSAAEFSCQFRQDFID